MKDKLFESTGDNQFILSKEVGIPNIPTDKVPAISGIRTDEQNLRLVQKALLQAARTIDKANAKVKANPMKYLFSEMSSKLKQYGGGSSKGYADVSVENLINWLKK